MVSLCSSRINNYAQEVAMKTVSYTNMRDHLAEIMEEVAQGE